MYEEGTVGIETTINFDNASGFGTSQGAGGSRGGNGSGANSIAFPAGAGTGAAFVMDFNESEPEGEDSEGFYTDDEALKRMKM